MEDKEAYIEHYVIDMDESMIQNCIFCGEEISDYRGAMWERGQDPPKGFAQGIVLVSVKKNPTILKIEPNEKYDYIIKCNGRK